MNYKDKINTLFKLLDVFLSASVQTGFDL